jgi:hypothetical protein
MLFLKNIFISLPRIHSSFFYIFIISPNIFEYVNSGITDFETQWGLNPSNFDKIHQIC